MTLGAGFGGNAASDWPVIAANRICAHSHNFARMMTLSSPQNRLLFSCSFDVSFAGLVHGPTCHPSSKTKNLGVGIDSQNHFGI